MDMVDAVHVFRWRAARHRPAKARWPASSSSGMPFAGILHEKRRVPAGLDDGCHVMMIDESRCPVRRNIRANSVDAARIGLLPSSPKDRLVVDERLGVVALDGTAGFAIDDADALTAIETVRYRLRCGPFWPRHHASSRLGEPAADRSVTSAARGSRSISSGLFGKRRPCSMPVEAACLATGAGNLRASRRR